MVTEPLFDTKAPRLFKDAGSPTVARVADIIAPDETRDVRGYARQGAGQGAAQIVVVPLFTGSSAPGQEFARLLTSTPSAIVAAYMHTANAGLRSAIGSRLFEATESGSTYEPVPDDTILAGFRRVLEARRVSVGDHHYHALHRQLVALLADEDELTEASVRPSMVSFAGLLEFLRWNAGLKHPSLSLDRRGHFVAAWQPRARAKLSITFDGLTSAEWIASDRSGQEPARGGGKIASMSASTIDERFRGWLLS